MSLYRKHRPQKFIDLIGQDHIRQTLINALSGGSFSHAYLFSGPKGSGKTTTARLLAKALNCQGRVLGKGSYEPCNKCISCKGIMAGSNLDMIEIDAASNRGIDEIRELRDKIRFAPSSSKYKVYIIDECHMLTKEAFNALLKTLEEPPTHAVFILATTEMHKVPVTIISRTQSFEFKKASENDILKLLEKTAKAENLLIDEAALGLIAHLSYGAFRDALSMLDQVASLQIDGRHHIKLDEVQVVLGQSTNESVWEFVESLSSKNRKKSLAITEKIYFEGKDLENFVAEVVRLYRKVLLQKAGLDLGYEVSKTDKVKLDAISDQLSLKETVSIMEKMITLAPQVKTSVLGQLPLEMLIFEFTEDEQPISKQVAEVGEVIDLKLEPSKPSIKPKADEEISVQTINFSPEKWQEVLKVVKLYNNTVAAILKSAVFKKTTDGEIILAVKFKFHAEQICKKTNLLVIEEAVLKVTGKNYTVECLVDKDLDVKKPLDEDEVVLSDVKEVFEIE